MFVVDLARHNDGEEGLVGPFYTRPGAEDYVNSISDAFDRKYATVRPIEPVGQLSEGNNQ